ncbi:NAD(P)H dehydrogenase (quinone)s [Striga asiatica]|uniref:NAD(P)H dehydrogenase (Quinone)s n=1 Tax=Striga asiatica TaxID=4170 RepID=A0A5A7P923_STRAF|nr:NAD(P)H dehydrogenase (quinone)s [Striga asiatica]
MTETEIPYFETEITKESSPMAIALAKHLRAIGAKLYGAFWCSHCLDQKQMFGREAAKLLDYVECFPDGVSTGTKMAKVCSDVKLEGFPTWVIKGQIMSGEKQLSELAMLAGIKLEDSSPLN